MMCMTIRRMWLWGCVVLLCGFSWTWAGKLGDFKKETVSDSDESSSEEDENECGILCSLLRALLSDSSDSNTTPSSHIGDTRNLQVADDFVSDAEPASAPVPLPEKIHTGDPLNPWRVELNVGRQWIDSGITSHNLGVVTSLSMVIIGVSWQGYADTVARERLDYGEIWGGLRLGNEEDYRVDIMVGKAILEGETAWHWGLAYRYYPVRFLGFWSYGGLDFFDSPVLNLGAGAELAWNYIGIRGGYQRRSVGRVVLAGPTIQLYWRL